MKATIYVPAAGSPLRAVIDRGSGIVAIEGGPLNPDPESGRVTVDYEGNRFGAENIKTYADRCYHAWSRQQQMYPTVARSFVARDELVRVGWLSSDDDVIPDREGASALSEWLDLSDAPLGALLAELSNSRPVYVTPGPGRYPTMDTYLNGGAR